MAATVQNAVHLITGLEDIGRDGRMEHGIGAGVILGQVFPNLTFALQSSFAGEGVSKSNAFITAFLKTPE